MTKLIIGGIILGLLLAAAAVWAGRSMRGKTWRPGAGILALACIVAGVFLSVVAKVPAAGALLILLGLVISMSVRRAPREPHRPPPSPPAGRMTRDEARAILGVGPDATPEEVKAAYLRLIRRTHPDQGGTTGLAAQLNAARDVLLKRD